MGAGLGRGELGPRVERGCGMRLISEIRERVLALLFRGREDRELEEELGYDAEGVAVVELGFNREAREGPAETFALLESVLEEMRGVPGVTAATPTMIRPVLGETGVFQARPMRKGQSESEAQSNSSVPMEVGDHELFRALGIPILRGRGLLETDREGAPKVAVVSQTVADRLWPGQDPIGRHIHMVTSDAH